MMPPAPLRLAIVGCGTVSEQFHAPALRGFDGFVPLVMVDQQPARAALLAHGFPGAVTDSDHRTLAGRVDAAIVALPSHLNAPVAADLLGMGISVLVEKPAALTVEAANALAAAESASAASLAVGFIRREAASVRMAKAWIDSGMLGSIERFSIEDGYPFDWTAVNEFRFDRERGGGILLDIGSHVLDLASYWFGDLGVTGYWDDNEGGVETDARIALATASGIAGAAELSWNRVLRNSARIVGSNGTLEVAWYGNRARLILSDGLQGFEGEVHSDHALAGGAESFHLMFLAQLQRWHASLAAGPLPERLAGSAEALANIALIAACRDMRAPLDLPWRSGTRISA